MTILAGNQSRTLAFSEAIAEAIGSYEAAIVLQQIHYYIEQGKSGRVFDGVRWIYNSYRTWCREFKLFRPGKVRQLINLLRQFELVRVEQLTKNADDKNCFWYTINYERVDALLSQDDGKKSSNPYSTGCVLQNTTPDLENTGCVAYEKSSIYTEKTDQKIHPIENNITEAAADSFLGEGEIEFQEEEEEEPPTSLADNPAQPVRTEVVGEKVDREDISASSACYHNNVHTLKLYGIALNKQLERIAAKYSEKEVERSLEYMEERIDAGKTIANKAGWLTDCLKDEWWRQSSKSVEEAFILEGLSEMGYSLNNPEAFFDEMWLMVSEGYIDPMPTDRWDIEGLVGNYLQITDGITYVNWADWSWQKKLDQNIFQSMSLTEAKRRFYEER